MNRINGTAPAKVPHPDGGCCATCKWGVKTGNGPIECHGAPPTGMIVSQQARHAITGEVQVHHQSVHLWPPVDANDWCASFEPVVGLVIGGE